MRNTLEGCTQARRNGGGLAHFEERMRNCAFQVVYQKFSRTPELQYILLNTGHCLIAEATPDDKIWGNGAPKGYFSHDPRGKVPIFLLSLAEMRYT